MEAQFKLNRRYKMQILAILTDSPAAIQAFGSKEVKSKIVCDTVPGEAESTKNKQASLRREQLL